MTMKMDMDIQRSSMSDIGKTHYDLMSDIVSDSAPLNIEGVDHSLSPILFITE
jgi:hypothetical protein